METLTDVTTATALVLGAVNAFEIFWKRRREITKPLVASVLLGVANIGLTIFTNDVSPIAGSLAGIGFATAAAGIFGGKDQPEQLS